MSQSFVIQSTLLGILLPAFVCGVSVLILHRFLGKASAVIGLASGFLVGFLGISGLSGFSFPPRSIQHWLVYAVIAGSFLGFLETFWSKSPLLLWLVRLSLLFALLWQLFQPFINHPFESRRWSMSETSLNLFATSLLIVVFWWVIGFLLRAEQNETNAIVISGLCLIAAGSSISIVLAHSLVMGQLTGVLAACLGAVALGSWIFKWELSANLSPLICLLLVLPWLSLYSSLPIWTVILLATSPYWLIFRFQAMRLWQQTALGLSLVSLPVVLAVFFAWNAS